MADEQHKKLVLGLGLGIGLGIPVLAGIAVLLWYFLIYKKSHSGNGGGGVSVWGVTSWASSTGEKDLLTRQQTQKKTNLIH